MISSSKHFAKILMAALSLTLLQDAEVNGQHGRYLVVRSVGLACKLPEGRDTIFPVLCSFYIGTMTGSLLTPAGFFSRRASTLLPRLHALGHTWALHRCLEQLLSSLGTRLRPADGPSPGLSA